MKLLLEIEEIVSVYIVHTSPCLIITWTGHPPVELRQEIYDKVLNFAMEYKVKKWLTDVKEANYFDRDILDWYLSNWFPKAIQELGTGHQWAIISSKEIMHRLSVKVIITEAIPDKEAINVAYFEDKESALAWLN